MVAYTHYGKARLGFMEVYSKLDRMLVLTLDTTHIYLTRTITTAQRVGRECNNRVTLTHNLGTPFSYRRKLHEIRGVILWKTQQGDIKMTITTGTPPYTFWIDDTSHLYHIKVKSLVFISICTRHSD